MNYYTQSNMILYIIAIEHSNPIFQNSTLTKKALSIDHNTTCIMVLC